MAEESHTPRPVQVFLDTRRFIDHVDPRRFSGGHRDFFEGNDEGFAAQKARIRSRLQSVASTMRIRREPAGFVHVQMREDAFGKSNSLWAYRKFVHRPAWLWVGRGR